MGSGTRLGLTPAAKPWEWAPRSQEKVVAASRIYQNIYIHVYQNINGLPSPVMQCHLQSTDLRMQCTTYATVPDRQPRFVPSSHWQTTSIRPAPALGQSWSQHQDSETLWKLRYRQSLEIWAQVLESLLILCVLLKVISYLDLSFLIYKPKSQDNI